MNKKTIIKEAITEFRIYGFDRRRAPIKKALALQINGADLAIMAAKQRQRRSFAVKPITHKERCDFLQCLKECKFDLSAHSSRYNCTGIDWKAFHRPSSNGKGWVLIAPDEPANNWYIEDSLLFKFLSKKFLQPT